VLLKTGKYKEISGAERDRLYFVGNVKNPVAIGKKGELFDLVDEEFFEILDLYRWHKCGMMKIEVEKHPAIVCNGVRALMEFS